MYSISKGSKYYIYIPELYVLYVMNCVYTVDLEVVLCVCMHVPHMALKPLEHI